MPTVLTRSKLQICSNLPQTTHCFCNPGKPSYFTYRSTKNDRVLLLKSLTHPMCTHCVLKFRVYQFVNYSVLVQHICSHEFSWDLSGVGGLLVILVSKCLTTTDLPHSKQISDIILIFSIYIITLYKQILLDFCLGNKKMNIHNHIKSFIPHHNIQRDELKREWKHGTQHKLWHEHKMAQHK